MQFTFTFQGHESLDNDWIICFHLNSDWKFHLREMGMLYCQTVDSQSLFSFSLSAAQFLGGGGAF